MKSLKAFATVTALTAVLLTSSGFTTVSASDRDSSIVVVNVAGGRLG